MTSTTTAAFYAAAILAAVTTSGTAHARQTFNLTTEFCGDRYCGLGVPTARTARNGHRLRLSSRPRGRPIRAHAAPPRPAPATAEPALSVDVVPLPRLRPAHPWAWLAGEPGIIWATVSVPLDAIHRAAVVTGSILDAFRRHVAEIVEPVRPGFVAVRTKSGRRAVVAKSQAWRFAGFLRDLEATGYRIRELGGYSYRRIAGTRTMSKHAFGLAIDVNQEARDEVSVPMDRGRVSRLAARWGLTSGGDWRGSPDLGHFEVPTSRTARVRIARPPAPTRYAGMR